MKILLCVSGNAPDFSFERTQVFVYEQIESICKEDCDIEYKVFAIKGRGILGYLKSYSNLKRIVNSYNPDIIHAHCGHVGALASFQRNKPVITTFHGTDINHRHMRLISAFAFILSKYSIFVSKALRDKLPIKGSNVAIIPCGVNRSIFHPMPADVCKKRLGIPVNENYILFASSFDNAIKNPELAKAVVSHFPNLTLREIKNKSREEVALLINGAELVLMTSISEGSPQIIKEAVSCCQKVVSVNVGDVQEQLAGIEGCHVCPNDEGEIVRSIQKSLSFDRPAIEWDDYKFDNQKIAKKILEIYYSILK